MSENHQEPTSFVAPPLEELDHLLEGYHFESFIAQGGMGAVYLASQTSLDRQVAIKVLPREFGEDEEFKKSFQSEAKLMAKLNHPNLIGIYDFGEIDGMLYIIMEFVKGKSLHDSAHGKAIAQKTAVQIISSVCSGLEHAHSAGILHRDIKPANILLGKGAIPKIGDFGLARANGITETGDIFGTPGYAAPEVLAAPEKVDTRTDVFAVGVMFYELLTGKMPADRYESVTKFVEADPKFDRIIQKAVHPNINMRYRSAQELANEINQIIKNPTPANKLLVAGASNTKPVALKAGGSASGAGIQTRSAPVSASAPAAMMRTAPSNSKLMRNIAIIFLLLAAIYVVLEMKTVREKEVADTQKIIDAAEAKKQKEKNAQRAAIVAEEQRAADLRAAENGSNRPQDTNSGTNTTSPDYVKPTPMEKLAKVKELLGNSERPMAMMPETIFMRDQDSRIIMFIDEKMTWDEADAWSREYGGYIAVCKSKSDLTVLMKHVPANTEDVWLGAGCSGDKGWSWVDDTPWTDTFSIKPTYKRSFAKFSKHGAAGKTDGDKKLNFFIEWRADGSNPADLEYRLLRTSDTLTDINPKYPPGTITAGARNFCIIKNKVTFNQASELAIASGGHLLVISNDDEKYNIEGIITENYKSGDTIWTAGEKQNNIWGWQTGEKWSDLSWAPTHPQDESHVVIIAADNLIIKDISPDTTADGFIIEWSKDKASVKAEDLNSGNTNLNGGLSALKNKAKLLVTKQRTATDKKLAYNVKKLWSDLETYLRGLPAGARLSESESIEEIIVTVKGQARVPAQLAGVGPSERARGYTNYAVEKQARIDLDHTTQIELLRTGYIKQLQKLRAEMENKSQASVVNAINEEAKDIGSTADDFENHFK